MNRDPKASTEPLSPTRFVLLLHSVPHLGEKTLTRLLHLLAVGRLDPDTCLALSSEEWQTRYELDPRAAAYLSEQRDALLAQSAETARTLRQHNLHVLTAQSLTYPDRLERFDDSPPPVLYALGNLGLLGRQNNRDQQNSPDQNKQATPPVAEAKPAASNSKRTPSNLYTTNYTRDTPTVAQTPTQEPYQEAYQQETCRQQTPSSETRAPFTFSIAVSNGADAQTLTRQDEIAAELVRRGCVPVTGHDRAAYKRLALAAQRQNKPTIYVMDRGLRDALGPEFDRPPFAAARIREIVFDVGRDLALSPFRLDDHALGANLRRRDRMIYALADLIVALDVRAGGSMVIECLRAHAQGRMVWVADGGRDGNAELRQAGCLAMPV